MIPNRIDVFASPLREHKDDYLRHDLLLEEPLLPWLAMPARTSGIAAAPSPE